MASDLYQQSVQLITTSWQGFQVLLSEAALPKGDLESICMDTLKSACDALDASDASDIFILYYLGKLFIAIETCKNNPELARRLSDKYSISAMVKTKRVPSTMLTNAINVLDDAQNLPSMEHMMSELMRLQLMAIESVSLDTPFIELVDDRLTIESKATDDGGVNADVVHALQTGSSQALVKDILRIAADVGKCFGIPPEQAFAKMFDPNIDKVWSQLVGARVYSITDADSARWQTCIGIIAGGECTMKSMVALLLFLYYYKEILVSKKGRGASIKGCDKVRKWALRKEIEGLKIPVIFKE